MKNDNKENNEKRTKHIHSLQFSVWLYFILLLVLIFLLLWIFQIIFLPSFYENYKIRGASQLADEAAATFSGENSEVKLTLLALDNSACIVVVGLDGTVGESIDAQNGMCFLHSENFNHDEFIPKIAHSEDKSFSETYFIPVIERDSLFFAKQISDPKSAASYVFVEMPLSPADSFVEVIKLQVLIISIILFIIASIIAFAVARKLSKPIERLTKSAEHLAECKTANSINFEGNEYKETAKLAAALNYASGEISQTTTLQRDLIANVSHDLRTPLTMIKGYAEMIRDISGDNPEKRNEHVRIIVDETDRLAGLVSDMLDLSKLESGGQPLQMSTFDIRALLESIVERYKEFCEANGYELVFIPDESIQVRCDKSKIQQVIYNLVNNAINYSGADNTVIVKQSNSFNTVKIEVSDRGKGIDSDNIHLVFDKYYRTERSKREVVGTGLGLSIVQAVLKKHNFPYGVKSNIGAGTTFWFKIVLAQPDKQQKTKQNKSKKKPDELTDL